MGKFKRLLPALLVFVVSFATTALLCPYALMGLKDGSLFLFSPDYFAESFALKAPLWHVVKSFVLQFFDLKLVAPALISVAATLLFVIVRIPLRRSQTAVHASATLISAAVIVLAVLPSSRAAERLAKLQINSRNYKWEKVLKVATPDACAKNASYRPYAALALASKGQLEDCYRFYSISRPSDLDMEGDLSRDGLFFGSLLYDAFGCPNEAIHRTFQAATHLDHGTSFETLCQLVRYNIEIENYSMVRKYAEILGRSPRHYFLSRKLLKIYGNRADREDYRQAAFITDNPVYNVAKMTTESGRTTLVAVQYFKTYSMLNSEEQ